MPRFVRDPLPRISLNQLGEGRAAIRAMRLTKDESRALGFIALLLLLSAAARMLTAPRSIDANLAGMDARALESASRAARGAAAQGPAPLSPGERIDANSAGVDQLIRLPRVSRSLAERIVADRATNGLFRSLADLDRVPGIGPATLAALRDHVSLPETAPNVSRPGRPTSPGTGLAAANQGRSAPAGARIDVNRATVSDLETVPGIGPVLAARIIAYRDTVGRFTRLDQLTEVAGIGPRVLERIGPHLSVGGG